MRLAKVIAEEQKAFTDRTKDMENFLTKTISCVKHMVFRNTKTPSE